METKSTEQLPAATHETLSHIHALDLAGLQGDGAARASDDGRRRALACSPFPAGATPQVCVAAWHGALHWLAHKDESITTCLVGQRAEAGWPVVTSAGAETSLAQLLAEVHRQWPRSAEGWLDLRDPAHAELLSCHMIWLEARATEAAPELALVRGDDAWQISCAATRYSETYQRFLMTLWHRFVVALLERPRSLLSEQTCAGVGDTAGTVGPVVSIAGNLVQRFAARVAATPGKPAVIDDHGGLSFAELDALSSAWAQALRAAGAQRGGYVGVAFPRGRGMVAAQYAVLKTGAAFVPMDASQPAARLQAMADDTDMRLVLGDAAAASILRDALPGVSCLAADDLPATADASHDAASSLGTEDPAYVIFTSGSTGKPKGVKVSHGNLLNFVVALSKSVGADDVMSQFAPFTFDASVAEIHTAILHGATLVILSAKLIDDPDRLQAYMTEKGVSFAAFPPQYAQHLSPAKLPRLKTLLTAGSAPDRTLVGRWQPHVCYINGYGPTETTVLSTAWQASRVLDPNEPISIGTPICNTEVRVVNRFNQSLPHGLIGELLIGGEGVAHGYFKRDALTRERFITLDQKRWYRSGDLAWFNDGCQLIFAGRVDDQIKLRGHRLEPGEVEVALACLPGVRQAAVIAIDISSGKQLIAFCAGERHPEGEVRAQLADRLPAWAIPNRIVWLDQLPTTVNGKIDYRSLRQSMQAAAPGAGAEGPAGGLEGMNPVEGEVAQVWRNVLQQPVTSPDDNFVHLGGDSLTALVVMSALKRIGYSGTASQLLGHPRLADFAALLERTGTRLARNDERVAGTAPLGPIQGWFFELGLSRPGPFCQTLVFETDEALDPERLSRALRALVAHHDGLRARFVRDEQLGWRQEIAAEDPEMPAIEIADVADEALDAAAERIRISLADQLDIGAAPLFRMALLRSPRRSRVVWVLHHLVVDTISHGVLLEDLQHVYASGATDPSQALPGKTTSYLDWSTALYRDIADHADAHLRDWAPLLREVSTADRLPFDAVAAGGAGSTLSIADCRLPRSRTADLIERATACYRQSPEELVLAATCLALQRSFTLRSLAIDVEWHGRDEATGGEWGIDRTVGWFTSVHPLRLDSLGSGSLGEWLMALKERRAAIPSRGRHFYAMRYLSPDPATRAAFAGYRAPQILFNFSGVVQRSTSGWRTVPTVAIEMGEGNANPYAASVESEIRDGELIVSVYFDSAAWPAGTAQSLTLRLREALEEVLEHCLEPANARWTASDFPRIALERAELDQLPRTVKDAYPLTDVQRTMYRYKDIYQVVMCYRMPESFEEAPWTRAVADWISRHDCLRTYFRELPDGGPYQVVLSDLSVPATVLRVAAGEERARADALVLGHRAREVRLDRAPLFDLSVIDGGGRSFEIVLAIHHLIHDGWSIDLLLNDLLQSYRYRRGLTSRAPAAPLATIADVVDAQQRLVADSTWRDYWRKLPWSGPAVRLPGSAKPRPSEDTAGGREVRLLLAQLDPVLVDQVRAGARRLGVTVNSLWLSGFAMLLRYLGGDAQVRCGVIQSGRVEDIPGVNTITGCCVNTLPLVLDIHPEDTVGDLVTAVASQLDRMRESAAFPLSCIHQDAQSRIEGELFHVLFNIEAARYGADDGAARPQLTGGYESTDREWVFSLIERQSVARAGDVNAPPEYEVRVGYDAARYDPDAMREWVEIYAQCMRVAVSQQESSWRGLRLLPDALAARAVQAWNDTERDYPEHSCVEELFRARAAAAPHATALLYHDATWSYAELDAVSDALAAELQRRGVGPGTIAALLCERSPEWVIAMLALFKAGGAFAAVDPRYPPERVRHILTDSAAALALVQKRALDSALPSDLPIERFYLQDFLEAHRAGPGASAPRPVGRHPRQLAYVMYTSGSSGAPKGVMIEQRSIVRLVAGDTNVRFAPDERWLLTCAPGFDPVIFEIWAPLLNGLGLVLVDEDTLLNPRALVSEVQSKRVTSMVLVTALFNQLAHEAPSLFASLRRVLIGGDVLSVPYVQAARAANPRLEVINAYGPTENTTISTLHCVGDSEGDVIPIGRPIANSTAYVFNADGQMLPPGIDGELWVGGAGVARGYLNQPELTSAKFVPDPFSGDPQARLYRTGDLARWRRDGLIDFLGRVDNQVKFRGFRIELSEIENTIAAHPGVKEAAVLVKQEGVQKQLVAYCTLKDTEAAHGATGRACALEAAEYAPVIGSIVEGLRRSLPEYMVPAAFVVMSAMPLTANAKVDRKALPEPDDSAYLRRAYEAPQGEVETALAAIWADLLTLDRIGRHDSFFELGGHSLAAVQLASRVRSKFEIELPIRTVFESSVLWQLAQVISGTTGSAQSAIRPVERRPYMPLSLAQRRLWFLTQIDGASAAYHIAGALRLTGALDRDALERALRRVVERHEALRTRFALIDGQPMQVVSDRASLDFSYRDLRGAADRERICRDGWRAFFERPFDLSRDPPLRAQLVRLEDDVHEVSAVMHHIVSDGWSTGVLLEELSRLYTAETEGRSDPLPPLQIQYADYAHWQREWLAGGRLESQSTFWREALSGAPTLLELPTDRPRPAQQDYAGAALDVRLDNALTSRLKALSQRCGTTLYMTLLSGWGAALGRLARQEDVVIGSPVAGRNRAEVEPLIGFFVNTLALRIDLSGEPAVTELLSRTKARVLEAQAHQDLPFDQVVEAVKPPRAPGHSPIFQAMLAWQNQRRPQLSMPGVEALEVELPATTAQFDLTLTLEERDGGIVGDLNYATALFDRGTVERYLGYWLRLLKGMTEAPDRPVASIPLLDAAERSRVLFDWNATAADYAREACIHELIEAQAARTPEAVALVYEDQRLSYRELEERSNQLAQHLRTLGVGPEVVVGCCVERSIEMVVGLLGVLKAGGAYVPLDPELPPQRLGEMVKDVGTRVVLTQVGVQDRLSQVQVPVQLLRLDADWGQIARCAARAPAPGVRPHNLAYVIFTSGSTGKPKAAMNEHGALVNRLQWMQHMYRLDETDRVLQKTPFSFDVSVWEFFWPLLTGATLVMARPGGHRDPAYLGALIRECGITTLHFVPSMLQVFLDAEDIGACPTLRRVITSGEGLPGPLAARFLSLSSAELHNLYGPTEAAIDVSFYQVKRAGAGTEPIGRPIWNTHLYVLDERMQPVAPGVGGELYIGGVAVGRGYLGRPDLTAERFVSSPFVSGERLYRTGDLARWRADGELEYLGRTDHQVKIRGFRIELGEIEHAIAAHPGVKQAVVLARQEGVQKRLVAYCTLECPEAAHETSERVRALDTAEHAAVIGSIAEGLRRALPEYMVPAAFVVMSAMPLNANGKIDRKALPEPGADAYARRAYEVPQGEVETALAAIWADLLKQDRIGRHDNFFELGGHSLIAVTLIERMRKQGLRADVRELFTAPTLKEFAESLRQQRSEAQAPPNRIPEGAERITPEMLPLVSLTQREIDAILARVPGGAANVQDIYPLSPLQEGMLFQRLLHPGGDVYQSMGIVSFAERSRAVAYLAAVQAVVDRHDILRTSFSWEGLSEPVQIVQRKAVFAPEELPADASGGPAASRLAAACAPAVLRMDLTAAPILRCRWTFDPQSGRWLACFVFHHLVIDHTTLETILEEVALIEQGRAAELPRPVPFRNYVWRVTSDEDRSAQKAFFSRMLGEIDRPMAPFGLNAMNETGSGFEEATRLVPAELSAELRQRARELGVSAAALMHLAWAVVLSRATGLDRVVFGTVLFGRMNSGEDADRALGMFINTLPIRIDLDGAGLAEAVRKTHTALAELLSHEHASLAEAQRCSRVPAGLPLFTSLLNYRYSAQASAGGDDVRTERVAGGERTNYPLTIAIDDRGTDFEIGAQTMPSLGAQRVCELMHTALVGIATALRAGPAAPTAAVDVLPAGELERILGADARTAAAERYWQAYFEDLELAASASLPLAPLRADEAASSQRGEQALETRGLSIEATARLARLARAEGVDLGTLMLAAWGLLLSKYNGEPEVLFGYATNRRPAEVAGSEARAGLRIKPLPLRLKIEGDRQLGAWLEEIQRRQRDHEDHGHLALADIQRCSGAPGGQALFDILVAVDLPRTPALDGVERNDFALDLAIHTGERLALELTYRSALFDAADMATLLGRLEQLLASLAQGGTQRLAQLSLLSEAEWERALRQWNDTAVAYPGDRSAPALFEAMARSRGAAVALVGDGETWTYEQLDERVRLLAAWLSRNGVSAGSRVALSLRKEPALVASMLAIMRCGGAYVPIALDCPPERRAFVLADAVIHLTLARRSERDALADGNVLCLEDCPPQLDDAACRAADVDPESTAYVIYTSGTTGTPKGVALSHRNLVNFCSWIQHANLLRPGDRLTQFAPFTFDASAGEIFAGLLNGAELHLLSDALIHDPRAFAQYLGEQHIRFGAFPPTYLQQLDTALLPTDLTVVSAGSAPTPELVRRFGARCRFINAYGPTETTVLSSAWICERGEVEGRRLSIGRPISNTRMYVVDRLGQPCAPGLVGEIWIGGDGVAQGYLNRPDLTDRQFVRDPWVEGGRVYRTGDYGRWLEDGSIEFVGRRDRQVKLRGFRIELNEIEKRLRAHPQVRDAAVLVRETDGEQRLLAWVVPAQAPAGEKELVASIREFMLQSVPEYMLPQAIMPIAQLPLTAHGKVDERALPQPESTQLFEQNYVAARTPAEASLIEIWASVLKLDPAQISATANFFDLGGHSLLAMRVVSRLREALGLDIKVAELFARPVLADLATVVQTAKRSALPPVTPVERDAPLPVSFAQQSMWLLAQLSGVSQTYHIPGILRLTGRLDRAALRRALDRIVERHETLRTTFAAVSGQPRQVIHAATGFALREHDLRGRPDADEQLAHLIREENGAAFDLATGPLIRGRLVQLRDDEHLLLITMHHIVSDGWSISSVMVHELNALYCAFCAGETDPLPPLSIQYADYAAWQRRWLTGEVLQAKADHWRRTLAGAPALLELPTDRPRPPRQDYTGGFVELELDEQLTAALKALSQRHGTTLYMTLLAAWATVLARLSGQHDVVIGTPTANRTPAEVEPLIGFFVNTLALRIDLSGGPTISELLQRVKTRTLEAQEHQDFPFERVVEVIKPARSLAHTPVFQVMFAWQNNEEGAFDLPGLTITPVQSHYTTAKFDLTLSLGERAQRIGGELNYATALFDRATAERHVDHLRRLLQAMVADEGQPVDRLPMGDEQLIQSLSEQLAAHRHALAEQLFPFSAIQREFMQWSDRDALHFITIEGRYSAEDLQRAFSQIASEQDLLRAVPDLQQLTWKLLPAAAASAARIPVVDLRASSEQQLQPQLKLVDSQLHAARGLSPLPYVAAWVSMPNDRHHLVLEIDHLIWDGMSAGALRAHLLDVLRGSPRREAGTYRDYIRDAGLMANQSTYDRLNERFNHPEIAAAMQDTIRALEARAGLPRRVVWIELPVSAGSNTADQAFHAFKRWVSHLTGLARFEVVLNHFGRQLGTRNYFNQVGLFLDKIPFAVTGDTTLKELNAKVEYLQKAGINYVSLEKAAHIERVPTLPPVEYEILFNFQANVVPELSLAEVLIENSVHRGKTALRGFHGIVCDAFSQGNRLLVSFTFEGTPADVDVLLQAVPQSKLAGESTDQDESTDLDALLRTVTGRKLAAGWSSELAYWRKQLAGAPTSLELPVDRPRPRIQTSNKARLELALPAALSPALRGLAQREGVPLFALLEAAFAVLVSRHAGQDDVCVATSAVGGANSLILRTDLSGDPTFLELLARTRETVLGAFDHQGIPFAQVLEELRPERDLSRPPFSQVHFAMEDPPPDAAFDLSLSIRDEPEAIAGTLAYNADLFDRSTLQRLLDRYQVLLESAAANPRQRVSAMPMLPEAERRQLVVEWNATARERGGRPSAEASFLVPELFEAQVARTPDAPAVRFEERCLSFRELNARANQLAWLLRRLGVGPDVRVALGAERSVDAIVALLGILKAGGAYLPLDLRSPHERLEAMLTGAQVGVLVGHARVIGPLGTGRRLVCLDSGWDEIAREPDVNPPRAAVPEGLAYVIYTSGSTGQPKGVGVEHRQLGNYVHAILRRAEFPQGAQYAMVSTFAADLGHTVLFAPLCYGGCLHVLAEERLFNPTRLAEYFKLHRIDCLKATPSHVATMQAAGPSADVLPRARLVLGGEPSRWPWVQELQARAKGCTIFNHYGPTETTVGVLAYRVEGEPPAGAQTLPLGRPLDNCRVYVLDRWLQPMPIGVPGELYIGGRGVSRGYLRRPDLTAECFIPDPFGESPGARLYRTGDRARVRADGNVEFLGRVDHQIKIRGHRIELGEVEAALRRHPLVRDAVVLAVEDALGAKLAAYVVPSSPTTEEALREHLHQHLPHHMVPSAFILMEALPLTANGKVDRKALPHPDQAKASRPSAKVLPHNPVEALVAGIWSEILDIPDIGVDDNFFTLGGHSILIPQVLARIQETTGLELSMTEIFTLQTVKALAEEIAARIRGKHVTAPAERRSPLIPLQNLGSQRPLFCVHPTTGNALSYFILSSLLGPDQPCYGLQAPELFSEETFRTVEERASRYVSEMRQAQPRGPYRLLGYSAGGIIAFEMAQQLRRAQQEVELLAIVDGLPEPSRLDEPALLDDEGALIGWFARKLKNPGLDAELAALEDLGARRDWALRLLKTLAVLPPSAGESELRGVLRASAGTALSFGGYRHQPYEGPVLFLAGAESATRADPTLGWGRICPRLQLQVVRAPHQSLLGYPHVREIVGHLSAALSRGGRPQ